MDRPGFEEALADHGQKSRGQAGAFDVFAAGPLDALRQAYHDGSTFLGYETTEADAKVIGIVEQGRLADSASTSPDGPPVALVLNRTPFYGESGGQVGDTGVIAGDGFRFEVEDTKKDHDVHPSHRPSRRW